MLSSRLSDITPVLKPLFIVIRIVPYILKPAVNYKILYHLCFSSCSRLPQTTHYYCQILGIWEVYKLFRFHLLLYGSSYKINCNRCFWSHDVFCCFIYKRRINSVIYSFRLQTIYQHFCFNQGVTYSIYVLSLKHRSKECNLLFNVM